MDCKGCPYWKWAEMKDFYYKFRYCEKFKVFTQKDRKIYCGGKFKPREE